MLWVQWTLDTRCHRWGVRLGLMPIFNNIYYEYIFNFVSVICKTLNRAVVTNDSRLRVLIFKMCIVLCQCTRLRFT